MKRIIKIIKIRLSEFMYIIEVLSKWGKGEKSVRVAQRHIVQLIIQKRCFQNL